jgi:AcrR family transcriptional regulator
MAVNPKINRKENEIESRRGFIIKCARRLFAQKGIENSTMEDIAVMADYTRRTLYTYFKSFDEICLLVLLEDQGIRWEMQKAAVGKADTGLAKLRAWAGTLYKFVRDNPQYARLEAYWDYRGLNPGRIGRVLFNRFVERNNKLADGLREIIRQGIADGSMRSDLHTDMIVSQFLYSLRSIINRTVSPGYSFAVFDSEEYVNNYIDLFCRGISVDGGIAK